MGELSEEYCPHCDEGINIPDDVVSICMCGKEVYPCNACLYGSDGTFCDWEEDKGCCKFRKLDKDGGVE